MKKLLLIAAVLLAACSTWVHPDPYRKLSADKSACSREVLSYLPRPDVLSYTYEELQIARNCLEDRVRQGGARLSPRQRMGEAMMAKKRESRERGQAAAPKGAAESSSLCASRQS